LPFFEHSFVIGRRDFGTDRAINDVANFCDHLEKIRPDLAMIDGLVVTPSTRPVDARSSDLGNVCRIHEKLHNDPSVLVCPSESERLPCLSEPVLFRKALICRQPIGPPERLG
jgi:hypothetical protein